MDKRAPDWRTNKHLKLLKKGIDAQPFYVGNDTNFVLTHKDESNNQRVEYAKSFLKVIKWAKLHNVKSLLYLEDDTEPRPEYQEVWKKFEQQYHLIPDWDLLYFTSARGGAEVHIISDNILKIKYATTLQAVIIKNHMFDHILANIYPSSHYGVDHSMGQLQQYFNCYSVYPDILQASSGWSYNDNRFIEQYVYDNARMVLGAKVTDARIY